MCVAVHTQDLCAADTGSLQLLSEGTPPLVVQACVARPLAAHHAAQAYAHLHLMFGLQHCTDVWDGVDVRPLEEDERKSMLDFYHQMSRSMLCVALSYRPIAGDQSWFDNKHPVIITLPPNYDAAAAHDVWR